jgi:hypothetical protein
MISMAIITISGLDIQAHEASKHFHQVAEADIRDAHGQTCVRPTPRYFPGYVYEASVRSNDEDQKAYDAEVEAQRQSESGTHI